MKKALVLFLSAILLVSLFISCGPEPIPEITIKFDGNGSTSGQMSDKTVVKGEEFTLPDSTFTRTDYNFVGWNTAADRSGTWYPDGDTVSFDENTTLYAQWEKEVVSITFEKNGGTGSMPSQLAIKGEETTLRQNKFTRENYRFIGWNTASDRGGTWYSDSDTATFEENTTLYAQWEKEVATIKFDANGASGVMFPQWVIEGEATALRPNRFSWTGHYFIGWNTKADGSGMTYPDGETISFNENTTLYAQWGFNGVAEIKYDANGGSGRMLPQWVIKDVETVLRQNRFSQEDHFFTGWNTKADGTGDAYSDADTATFEKDTTLYAQWHKNVAKIIFNANGGGGLMFPQWVNKGEETALKTNKFSWKGHCFTRWTTQKDGTGTQYADRAEIKTDSDITLYAQWVMDISTMADKTRWNESDGKYFTLSANVTIDERVEISGDITLILPEGMTLTAKKGITLSNGNALTIGGSGTLVANATEEEGSAGIGGEYEQDCGTITINGGTINAIAGEGGAGIGGGSGRDYGRNGGTITINEGTVKATGNEKGAGIGGGSGMHSGGDGGTITINGGTIEATGGRLAAGIGAGHGPFGGNCGTVTINGGTVNASGGDGGAGIGGGITEGECGTVTINGGTVIANGIGGGAGIGGGYSQSGVFVTINGGTVKAASDASDIPAIGPGRYNNLQGRLTIGYSEIQANSLVINSGWSLYYGNSKNPSDHVDGPHDGNDIESYRGRYMNITAPST